MKTIALLTGRGNNTLKDKNILDISKPLKCGYNPYTGEWEEWSQNPIKQKIIKYYGIDETL